MLTRSVIEGPRTTRGASALLFLAPVPTVDGHPVPIETADRADGPAGRAPCYRCL